MDTILNHRSIRNFSSREIPQEVLDRILHAATRASTVGNMQVYTLIVSRSAEMRERLSPCHFNQPMVKQAPVVVTVCADINRFSQWCRQRGAEPEYDNFVWFINGTIDAILASQNMSLAAEEEGLGICYLGTTLYTADKIIDILDLPKGVIPITTVIMGYPEIIPQNITDRLPVSGVVMYEKYTPYSEAEIDSIWAEKEALEETQQLIKENNLPNLARIFTDRRYTAADNKLFSEKYFEIVKKQGFIK